MTLRKTYYIQTFGCQMNENDSEHLAGQLTSRGFQKVTTADEAGVILLNTCCIRDSAERKIYGRIGQLRRLKLLDPTVRLIVAGCLGAKDAELLQSKAPHLDAVLGTQDFERLGECLDAWHDEESPMHAQPETRVERSGTLSAWVPIMYGCDNFCSYCIVPHVRGRERSRTQADIVAEIEQLSTDGFREITLLGQNVNSFGKDLHPPTDFAALLKQVDETALVPRVRFMTSHPRDMNTAVIEAIATGKTLCEHIHLPIQSGSDHVLTAMNRGYSRQYYVDLVQQIRLKIPQASLTTDIIVGFPGETEELFLETLQLLTEVRYDSAFVFLFSPRTGTPAATLAGQVDETEKKARLHRINAVQNQISLEINQQLVGMHLEVMAEGPSKNDPNMWAGRTRTNKLVLWRPEGNEQPGDFVHLRIEQAQTWLLRGTVV